MTGSHAIAKDAERRRRAAAKEAREFYEAPARLRRVYAVSLESAELAVRTHGVEMAEKLAAFVAENGHVIGFDELLEAYRYLAPTPKNSAEGIRSLLEKHSP